MFPQEVVLVYVPSILGSLCFTISSRVYVAEVSHSFWSWLPERMSFGYTVAICNFIGSALFLCILHLKRMPKYEAAAETLPLLFSG